MSKEKEKKDSAETIENKEAQEEEGASKIKAGKDRIKLYEKVLVEGGYISQEDYQEAIDYAEGDEDKFLDFLYSKQLTNNDLLGQAMAEYYGVQYADLNSHMPSAEQVAKIPEKIAKKHRTVLFSENKDSVTVASDKPIDEEMRQVMEQGFSPMEVKFAYSLTEDIDEVLMEYRKPLNTRFAKIIEEENKIAPEIIEEIIADSLVFRASDIHFEPRKKTVLVRFRVDGVLREAGKIPRKYHDNIVNRVKVQAKLRIDDHFSAQDGSMRFKQEDKETDLRISIVPTLNGEKIVMRVLAEYVKGFDLGALGLSEEHRKIFEKSSKKPFGMILVTGPTGSGKTTTLYALLRKLNKPEVNIMTIEDPVEYQITGINQIQANSKTNLTFSQGLRSIVRQDPDVILVGEIRDKETAEIAVNAALTGHLLFSTFHANDSATAIPRLLDMNVEPFLLSSTLEMVVAQRLVRKICESCKASVSVSKDELEKNYPQASPFFAEEKAALYKGKGCDRCNHSGFKGRSAIFEIIEVTDEMQDLILDNPSTNEIWKLARKQGAKSLYEDGIEKVKSGITTLAELERIAEAPSEEELEVSGPKVNTQKKEKQFSASEKADKEMKELPEKEKETSEKQIKGESFEGEKEKNEEKDKKTEEKTESQNKKKDYLSKLKNMKEEKREEKPGKAKKTANKQIEVKVPKKEDPIATTLKEEWERKESNSEKSNPEKPSKKVQVKNLNKEPDYDKK
ncbi:MAG: ATPase, T2SS/T4P/T4SS family [Candidatus Moranbacteria bacterium]|nr:ATPase, T2SS/T4P/T4SS family [Candidatus Moranbacteria bacterium]